MSEDYKSGKFENGLILPEKEFSKSLIMAYSLPSMAGLGSQLILLPAEVEGKGATCGLIGLTVS